jgi:phthiodiolone/phenolphthiodiolone dimycocerosates ketoreductase
MAVAAAEELGVDSFWVPDHLLGIYSPAVWPEMPMGSLQPDSDAWFDPFVSIAAIGAESDLPMGVCVTDAIRRRAPDLARTALTLNQLCRGGFHLGVGAGEAANLVPFGYDFSTPVADLEQFLVEVRSLHDHGVMPSGGPAGRTGLPLVRDDVGPPEVWVGGQGRRLLRLAGQYGDGWLPVWPMSPAEYGEKCAIIAGHAERAGRPMPQRGMLISLILGESRDYVARLLDREPLAKLCALTIPARIWAEYGLRHPGGDGSRGLVDAIPHELDPDRLRELAPTIPVDLVSESVFIGNFEQILDRIGGYVDQGLEHLVLFDSTGIAGGLEEIEANRQQFSDLVAAVAKL